MALNPGLHQREGSGETQPSPAPYNSVISLPSPVQVLPAMVKPFQQPGLLNSLRHFGNLMFLQNFNGKHFLHCVCSVICNKPLGKKIFVCLHNNWKHTLRQTGTCMSVNMYTFTFFNALISPELFCRDTYVVLD